MPTSTFKSKTNMNTTKTNAAGVLKHLASLNHCSEVPQYALRVEWESDCVAIRAVLAPWLVIWREDQAVLTGTDGRPSWLPDLDVLFSLRSDGPCLQEVRWLIDAIVDCHVAAQSLSEVASYTGERLPHDEMDDHMRRPADQVIAAARDSARKAKSFLSHQFDRFEEAAERLDAELGDDAPYTKRLQERYARFWRDHLAKPQERANEALAQAAGLMLAEAALKPRKA
jgi:hypothetical protein